MDINELLDQKIADLLNQIDQLEPGSEARARAVKDASELIRIRTEKYKVEADIELRDDQLKLDERKVEQDEERNKEQDKTSKKFKWLDAAIRIGEFAITLGAYGLFFRRGMRFEETGTWRSPIVRKMLDWFKPSKLK